MNTAAWSPTLARPPSNTASARPLARERRKTACAAGPLGVEGVTLAFGGCVALDAVDLDVGDGEIHAVIGPNGAGKSSLINVISGLYAPDRGLIRIGGAPFRRVPTRGLARLGVARTFQNLALFKGLTVRDTVAAGLVDARRAGLAAQVLGLAGARREAASHRERAEAVIAWLDLRDVRDRLAGTLPYGVQTLLVAEQNVTVALRHADRAIVLENGRSVLAGTAAALRARDDVKTFYLGAAPALTAA